MSYEATFKYEILNEIISSIDAFIVNNYPKRPPSDIAKLDKEIWSIYRKLPFVQDVAVLEDYDKRLMEIRDYVYSRANANCEVNSIG